MTETTTLLARMKQELRVAMKAREAVRVATLRTMIAAVDNAGAVEVDARTVPMEGVMPDVPRRELSEADQVAILRGEADSRRRALAHYERLGQVDQIALLREELLVLETYIDFV